MNDEMAEKSEDKRHLDIGALFDLAVVIAILVTVKQAMLPISQLYAGPASTLSAMVAGTLLLRLRGLRWKDLGFGWPDSWLKTGLLTVLTLAVMIGTMGAVGWVVDLFIEDIGTSGRFDHIEGDLIAYLMIMGLVWTHAAFFEELLFRAFVINRASSFLGGDFRAALIAAVFSAVFFGYRHFYYQGWNGALTIGVLGFAMALLYLWFGRRSILPLILAHGIIDTLGMTYRFLGIEG